MPKFKIVHITRYQYENAVRDSANQILLYPINDEYQEVQDHSITVTGGPSIDVYKDFFGNEVGTFTHTHPHHELTIDSRLTVITNPRPLPDDTTAVDMQWKSLEALRFDMKFIDFLKQDRFEALPELNQFMEDERCKNYSPFESAKHFNEYIHKTFTYRKGVTTVETTLDEIWKLKSGVCQDFAHMLLSMLRAMNIPARYVSGYICPNKNGMRGEGATHAWVEVYIPFYGWLGLDPTNNCIANETHVRLAVGKNFTDCSPVKGTYRGTSDHTLDVTVMVSYEDGQVASTENEVIEGEHLKTTTTSEYKNSFRRFQEMQMQQ